MTVRTICLHGPESTGKTVLATALSQHLADDLGAVEIVGEYGRDWCEENGTTTSMADLVVIATEQERRITAAIARAEAAGRDWVILDTDAVLTAVWAEMLHGGQDPAFAQLTHTADLYLVPDIDLPWVEDGVRYLGQTDDRRRFMDKALAELDRRGLPYAMVRGQGEVRVANALAAVRGMRG
jgi:NadR type nicotinamide-nucleotide adenylyltransferase